MSLCLHSSKRIATTVSSVIGRRQCILFQKDISHHSFTRPKTYDAVASVSPSTIYTSCATQQTPWWRKSKMTMFSSSRSSALAGSSSSHSLHLSKDSKVQKAAVSKCTAHKKRRKRHRIHKSQRKYSLAKAHIQTTTRCGPPRTANGQVVIDETRDTRKGLPKTWDCHLVIDASCDKLNPEAYWKFDNTFYWFGLATGIASFCFSLGFWDGILYLISFSTGECSMDTHYFCAGFLGNVLIHELGHAEAARWYGRPVYFVIVKPFGGLCGTRAFRKSWQNGAMALAGPAAGSLHSLACLIGGYAWDITVLKDVSFFGFLVNGFCLLPNNSGDKRDGVYVWEALTRKEINKEDHSEKLRDIFPRDYSHITEKQQVALAVGYIGVGMLNLSHVPMWMFLSGS